MLDIWSHLVFLELHIIKFKSEWRYRWHIFSPEMVNKSDPNLLKPVQNINLMNSTFKFFSIELVVLLNYGFTSNICWDLNMFLYIYLLCVEYYGYRSPGLSQMGAKGLIRKPWFLYVYIVNIESSHFKYLNKNWLRQLTTGNQYFTNVTSDKQIVILPNNLNIIKIDSANLLLGINISQV